MTFLTIAATTVMWFGVDRPAAEIVRAPDGKLLALTNADIPFAAYRTGVVVPSDPDSVVFLGQFSGGAHGPHPDEPDDSLRIGGPISWGVVGDAVCIAYHYRPGPVLNGFDKRHRLRATEFRAGPGRVDFLLERQRDGWSRDFHREFESYQKATWSLCRPLMDYVREHADELYENWDITHDTVYTSLDDVTVVALREGRMFRWTLDDTGEIDAPWTAHVAFTTPIRGVFRVVRAGKDLANMYFVDETGSIYVGFGAEHRKIGTVRDYHHADETTLTLLFEDQMTETIGFLHAGEDGTITVLPIDWQDETFAADFLTELDSDGTRAGIVRLAEVLREDAEEGGGDE